MREDAALEVRGELALYVARQPAAVGIGVAQLRQHRLRVPRDQLVQHGPFRCPATIALERPSGRAGWTFVEAAREHLRAQWKFRAAIASRTIATFRSTASDARTAATPSARDRGDKRPRALGLRPSWSGIVRAHHPPLPGARRGSRHGLSCPDWANPSKPVVATSTCSAKRSIATRSCCSSCAGGRSSKFSTRCARCEPDDRHVIATARRDGGRIFRRGRC